MTLQRPSDSQDASSTLNDPVEWDWLLYCQRTLHGDAFVLMQRARNSHAIRRTGSPATYAEADVRALLASLGQSADDIDTLVTEARRRLRSLADS
jgi:hypothetical protein